MFPPNSFHDVRLPTDIEKGTQGGLGFYTTIISSPSGNEQRNQQWEDERGEWDIGYGIRRKHHITQVRDFFFARRGMAHGFRFRDWSDYFSGPFNTYAPCNVAVGDGVTTDFQLVKPYDEFGLNPFFRNIYQPLLSSLDWFVDGIEVNPTNLGSGLFRFSGGLLPVDGALLTAQFEFDVPVRFASDRLIQLLETPDAWGVTGLKIVGVRPPNY